jgi:DNA-binding response OmpR family regulator
VVGHYESMRVLVVEDNEVVAQAVATGLRDQGIAVDVAENGAAGLDKAGLSVYDVIVSVAVTPATPHGPGLSGRQPPLRPQPAVARR